MARGGTAQVNTTRVSANGYHYTKTGSGWRLTHHMLMEEKLGRPLDAGERVHFRPGALRVQPGGGPPKVDDLVLVTQGNSNARNKVRQILVRAEDLQKEYEYWADQLPEADRKSLGVLEIKIL